MTGSVIAADVPLPADRVAFEPVTAEVPALLAELVEAGDVVVTAGAGDVTTVGPALLELLRRRAVQVTRR